MPEAVIVDAVRTPIGRAFKGSLAQLRPDDSGAFVIDRLLERNPDVDPASVEEVIAGCGLPQGRQPDRVTHVQPEPVLRVPVRGEQIQVVVNTELREVVERDRPRDRVPGGWQKVPLPRRESARQARPEAQRRASVTQPRSR